MGNETIEITEKAGSGGDRRVTIRIPLHLYKKVAEYAEIECLAPGTFIRTVLAKEIKRRGNR